MTTDKRRTTKGGTPSRAAEGAATLRDVAAKAPALAAGNLVALCADLAARAVRLGVPAAEVADALTKSLGAEATPPDAPAARGRVEVIRMADDVAVPGYKSAGAVAWDIAHAGREAVVVKAGRKAMLESGLRLHIPDPDVGAFLFPRSSTGWEGLALANTTGVIDTDYQGQLLIPVRNTRRRGKLRIEPGQRIAQLVFMRIVRYDAHLVDDFPAVTGRGDGGFGSTGRH